MPSLTGNGAAGEDRRRRFAVQSRILPHDVHHFLPSPGDYPGGKRLPIHGRQCVHPDVDGSHQAPVPVKHADDAPVLGHAIGARFGGLRSDRLLRRVCAGVRARLPRK